MNYLLDTNTCIKYLNGRSAEIKKRLESVNPLNLYPFSVVKAELFYGAAKSQKSRENLAKITTFIDQFNSLPFDDRAAQIYGRIRCYLEKAGKLIGPNDLLIASIAIANKIVLVTNNSREFKRIKEIQIEDWEKL